MADYNFMKLDEWAEKVSKRMDDVAAYSTARVIEQQQLPTFMGGKMPIDTGELSDSLRISVPGRATLTGEDAYLGLLGVMKAGDVVDWYWSAPYALRMNYGFTGKDSLGREYDQAGYHFQEFGMLQWDAIVREETADALARNS